MGKLRSLALGLNSGWFLLWASFSAANDPPGNYAPPVLPFKADSLTADQKTWLKATPLTSKQAKSWFTFLAGQKDIPFRYPDDGCYARAHRMAKLMDQSGVISLKLYVAAEGDHGYFTVSTRYNPQGYVQWTYHVAPAVAVASSPGKYEMMVIDPSLFTAPTAAEKWISYIGNTNGGHYKSEYEPRFSYNRDVGTPHSWLLADLQDAEETNQRFLEIEKSRGFGLMMGEDAAFLNRVRITDSVRSIRVEQGEGVVTFAVHAGVYRFAADDSETLARLEQALADRKPLDLVIDADLMRILAGW